MTTELGVILVAFLLVVVWGRIVHAIVPPPLCNGFYALNFAFLVYLFFRFCKNVAWALLVWAYENF